MNETWMDEVIMWYVAFPMYVAWMYWWVPYMQSLEDVPWMH